MSKIISLCIFTSIFFAVTVVPMQLFENSVALAEELIQLEVREDPNEGIIIFWGESNRPDVIGYALLWRANSDSWIRIDLGQQADYVLKEIDYLSEYEFQVLVRYSGGTESEFSYITSFKPN